MGITVDNSRPPLVSVQGKGKTTCFKSLVDFQDLQEFMVLEDWKIASKLIQGPVCLTMPWDEFFYGHVNVSKNELS